MSAASPSPLNSLVQNEQVVTETAKLLKAMSNESRIRILAIIDSFGEISVTDLQKQLGSLSQSALSQHLAILRNAQAVTTRRQSQTIFYSLGNPLVRQILEMIVLQ